MADPDDARFIIKKRRACTNSLVQIVWKGYGGEQGDHPKFQNHPFRRRKYGAGKHFTCVDTFVSSNIEPRDLTPVKNVDYSHIISVLPVVFRVPFCILSEW